ncbi:MULTISPECIES: hypothetical protein [unclassified Streptomyces]|uniref:hypothetical protein n=1 Tax=unclassified Streptomyces TaxID=2593676 RepID=UPI00190CDCBB|nr:MULTISPECIES: hypothetical protein [unclassified Streptomyces]MBK3571301.1 hypothetical protein [Streptomyces sp. MBT62]MBK6018996.1 hypothetical protein [Streptomyces sp. MBT53]
MPRSAKKPRRLVVNGRTYLWSLRHSHSHSHSHTDSQSLGCVHTLTLRPQPPGTGGPLRIVFAEGPGRYVPGGAPLGSGDVGYVQGASLNLHEPGAVRALLDAAAAQGRLPRPENPQATEVDGWPLLEMAAAAQNKDGDHPTGPA